MTIGNFGSFCGLFGSQGPGRLRGACGYNQRVMALPDVVIVGAARTPIGRYGGALRAGHPPDPGAAAAKGAVARGGGSPPRAREGGSRGAPRGGARPPPPPPVGG